MAWDQECLSSSRIFHANTNIHVAVLHAGLWSRRILSDSGSESDSDLKISTPTPTPTSTSLQLRLNKDLFDSKNSNMMHAAISLISLLIVSKRVIANLSPIRANCGCRQSWLSLSPLNVIGMSVLECIDTVPKRSRWSYNYLRYLNQRKCHH